MVKSAQNLYDELHFAQFRPIVLHENQPKLYKLALYLITHHIVTKYWS